LKTYDPAALHRKALELACKLGALAVLTATVRDRWEMNLRFAYARGFLNGYAAALTGIPRLARTDRTAPRPNLQP
jgi:hypothetical protein